VRRPRDVLVSIADLLMMKPAPSFCDRGVNTFWIGLVAGAIVVTTRGVRGLMAGGK